MNVKEKPVLITGANRGIGAAIVSAFVQWGEAMDFDVNQYTLNRIEKLERRITQLETMLKNNQKKSEKDE